MAAGADGQLNAVETELLDGQASVAHAQGLQVFGEHHIAHQVAAPARSIQSTSRIVSRASSSEVRAGCPARTLARKCRCASSTPSATYDSDVPPPSNSPAV